jgi:hypothetical protein
LTSVFCSSSTTAPSPLHCRENLGGFVGCVNVVATPDLVVLRMSLHGVSSNNPEVVTSKLSWPMAVLSTQPKPKTQVNDTIPTFELSELFGCVDNTAIGQDNFEVLDIVRSPAVLCTQETHTSKLSWPMAVLSTQPKPKTQVNDTIPTFELSELTLDPAVLCTQETHTTYKLLEINSVLISQPHTSEHISTEPGPG